MLMECSKTGLVPVSGWYPVLTKMNPRAMIKFKRGDRVKLTDKAARSAMKDFGGSRVRINWLERRGTVKGTPLATSGNVTIIWDGNRAYDYWPKGAVELVEPG